MINVIKQLDNNTINKIAAGEVIESPKSIVKELVENSIDAGADEIIIEIKNGGKKYIRITDNGKGIEQDQIEDAFKRHYTSKITTAEDLESLSTLGFRGEALASIAAVAKVEIVSRTKDELSGTKLVIEGGKTILKEDIGCPIGTSIIVTDLFYNVPARLKFLKSDTSESSSINEMVLCLSLCTDNVSFKYINNNSTIFKTPKTNNMLNVLSSLYPKDMVSSLIEVNFANEYVKITGYTSNLKYYRGSRKNQLLFINNRFVKHKRANYFIEAAYNTLLPKDKHPACFLKIDIEPHLIDVNVHPAKTEIRLKDEDLVLGYIKTAVYRSLHNINLTKSLEKEDIIKKSPNRISEKNNVLSYKDIFIATQNGSYNNSVKSEDIITVSLDNQTVDYNLLNIKSDNIFNIKSNNEVNIDADATNYLNYNDNKINSLQYDEIEKMKKEQLNFSEKNYDVIEYVDKSNAIDSINDDIQNNKNDLLSLKVIGILLNTYILCENTINKEFYMIDQHAAHERVNYEKLLKEIENKNVMQQELLIPEIINLSYDDYYNAINNKEYFEKLGLEINSFGTNDIIINSIPVILNNMNARELFFTIFDSMKNVKNNSKNEYEMNKIIKNACIASVKAGDNLHDIEINKLIESLANCDSPYTCPHGRPTVIKMTKYEIERMFERIQA